MYYKLRDKYLLRGWADVPYCVADLETGNVLSFPRASYELLERCTGDEGLNHYDLTEKQLGILQQLCAAGITDASALPQPPLCENAKYKKYESRFIRQAHWLITGKCNYLCRHCYMAAAKCTDEDLPLETMKEIIRQMEECGILNVSISGGEALVRKDFWQIADELAARHITIRAIYSNGCLINEDFFENIRQRGIRPVISLSFDGINGAHDWLRGINNATAHFMKATRLIRENGLDYEAEFCAHRGNIDLLRDTVNFLAGEGCKRLKVNLLLGEGEGKAISGYCLSVKEAYDSFLRYIPQYYEDGEPLPIMLRSFFSTDEKGSYHVPGCRAAAAFDPSAYSICSHARTVTVITATGRVMPCVALDCAGDATSYGSITETPLKSLLEGSAYAKILNTRLDVYFEANPECSVCEYRYKCAGGCRAQAMIYNGKNDFLAKDEETCLLYKGGYYDKLRNMMLELGIEEK